MNNEHSPQVKKITLSFVLGWIFGVLVAVAGVALLFEHLLPGLLALLLAAVLLPPANKFAADKFNLSISGGLKAVIVIILLVLVGFSMPSSYPGSAGDSTSVSADQMATTTSGQETGAIQTNAQSKTAADQPAQKPASAAITNTTGTQVSNQNTSPVSNATISQVNAVKKAKSYLAFAPFSHDGLVAQLEYEKFSQADAIYGADNSGANWDEQAAAKARAYMEYSAFSRGSLIAQLEYDKFTQEQAQYGADAVGL